MSNIAEALKARETDFVEKRAKIEMEVDKFLASVDATKDERITSISGRPSGSNCKEVLPALWQVPFNVENYKAQLGALNYYITAVRTKCDELAVEAEKCIQECSPI